MKRSILARYRLGAIALLVPLVLLVLAACTTSDIQLIPGTIQSVEAAQGKLTVQTADGKTLTLDLDSAALPQSEGATSAPVLAPGTRVKLEVKDSRVVRRIHVENEVEDAEMKGSAEIELEIELEEEVTSGSRSGPNRGSSSAEIETEAPDDAMPLAPAGQAPAAFEVGEDFHFSGTIESMGANSFVIGGQTFMVDSATMLDNGLAVGVLARVEFMALADGSMLATEIETDAPDDVLPLAPAGQAPAAIEVGEDFHFSGTIESMGADSFVIGGQTFRVDSSTMLDSGLAVGVLARVEFMALADGSMLATEIETDAPDDVLPLAPAGQAPAAASEVGEDFHSSGIIESMGANSFVIGGQTFMVDSATMLDNGLAVGVLARVEFMALADGSMLATEIETDAPDEAAPAQASGLAPAPEMSQPTQPATGPVQDSHFSGTIESMGAESWLIGGRSFRVDSSTMLDTGLAVGVVVDVEFVALPDGTPKATKIETLISGKNR